MEKSAPIKGTVVKAFAEVKRSPVLLVIMYVKTTNIEPDHLYTVFSPFGRILRVLIFERGVATKAFVEFENTELANQAKSQLEGKTIVEDGTKASIFFANIDKIVFKSNSASGKDYTQPTEPTPSAMSQAKVPSPLEALRLEMGNLFLKSNKNTSESKLKLKKDASAHKTIAEFGSFQGEAKSEREKEDDDDDALIDKLLEDVLKESQMKFPEPISMKMVTSVAQFHTMNNLTTKSSFSGMFPDLEISDSFAYTAEQIGSSLIREPPGLQALTCSEVKPRQNPFINMRKAYSSLTLEDNDMKLDGPYNTKAYFSFDSMADYQPPAMNQFHSMGQDIDHYGDGMPHDYQNFIEPYGNVYGEQSILNFAEMGMTVPNLDQFANMQNDHRSPVIYVKGFDSELVNVTMIYNVFSNFGNILKIMYMRAKGIALIEYESIEYSSIARDYLNNIVILGSPLRIYFSKYESLVLRTNPPEDADEETFLGNLPTNRFKVFKSISINPPSNTLHISNLLIFCCKDEVMRNLFAPFGEIEALKFLFHENNRNMCLIRFSSLQDSIWALANLHNYDLAGRKIQISFTRSKV